MSAILLKSICKSYQSVGGPPLHVLKEVDLKISKADFTVISGPSGSGKSTLLNLIGALDKPDSGSVVINGVEIGGMKDAAQADFRNATIGFIFQSFHLIPVLTAVENVAWPLYLKNISRKQRTQQAQELLAQFGLASHMHKPPGKLSGGQRQRVAIARALIGNPKIVLADEPTANLDRKTGQDIMSLLLSLNKENGVTFIFSTHDHMVASYAKCRLFLQDGKLIDQTSVNEEEEAYGYV